MCACKRLCSPTRVHPHTYTHTLSYTERQTVAWCVSCVCSYVADLLLSPSESLHLRSVGHDAEPSTFALLKVLLILHLQEKQRERNTSCQRDSHTMKASLWQCEGYNSIYIWCAAIFSSSTSVTLLHKDKHQLGVSSRVLPRLHSLFSVHKRVHTDKCGYMTSTARMNMKRWSYTSQPQSLTHRRIVETTQLFSASRRITLVSTSVLCGQTPDRKQMSAKTSSWLNN